MCAYVQISNIAKVCVQNVLHVLGTSLKTWTPLPDRFIDEHLVKMLPLFNQAWLQLIDVTNSAAVHSLLQLP